MASIQIRNLRKTFGRFRALDRISLEIGSGEMVGLIGASGSGKSTLLRHISGLTVSDCDDCEIEFDGRTIQCNGSLARDIRELRAQVGFVFQQFNLVGRMTVITNVLAGMLYRVPCWRSSIHRFTRAEIAAAIEALSRVGIAEHAWQRASTLSGGQQQRAAIARALVQRAKVILADEPIASLDPESSRRVMEILLAINREDGCTIVVSLHQVQVALKYCPRVVGMQHGRIVFDGPTDKLTPARLQEIYGADIEEMLAPSVPSFESYQSYPAYAREALAVARM
ncbi:MAG: phosphonate ABC transporter ATP-binding protein [Burkholderiales bacterium]